ncbi:MAG: dihydrolipoyl dehydrogenase [Planctomycetota bacterium]|nr:dihydrolipoyl dehydrogenase [Planctomycetota bacterium]
MYDVLIIGGGPGGYACALRAAQLGLSVALVEKRGGAQASLGGTCLHVGCIPSKALLDSSERFWAARHDAAAHGIVVEPRLDLAAMMRRKQEVVETLARGLDGLMRKHRIAVLAGRGEVLAAGRVRVTASDGRASEHAARHIVLATGSEPISLPVLPCDGERIVTSDQAIAFREVPPRLLVIGGGAIGLELGSVWARLGSAVTVLEATEEVCPFLDADVAAALRQALTRQGLQIHCRVRVSGGERRGETVLVRGEGPEGPRQWEAERVLVAVGRRPHLDGIGPVALTERGRVRVDEQLRTSVPGIWAIGDVVEGPMLAHKAEEEGIAVAERIAGRRPLVDHDLIPSVVYTEPEAASVGRGEARCRAEGRAVRVGRFPFAANGRARAAGQSEGFVKVIAEAESDRLLGVAIVGPRAADLIGIAAAHLAYGGSSEDIARTCLPHPTASEALREAALAALGRALHA